MFQEIWKEIVDFPDYQISNYGRVKSFKKNKEKILKPYPTRNGYLIIRLSNEKMRKLFSVHGLVAIAFIPNLENKSEVNHIDSDKKNNCVTNLEWNTRSENMQHRERSTASLGVPVIATNIDTGEEIEFRSQIEAGRNLRLPHQNISSNLKGKYKRVGRYTFRYKGSD